MWHHCAQCIILQPMGFKENISYASRKMVVETIIVHMEKSLLTLAIYCSKSHSNCWCMTASLVDMVWWGTSVCQCLTMMDFNFEGKVSILWLMNGRYSMKYVLLLVLGIGLCCALCGKYLNECVFLLLKVEWSLAHIIWIAHNIY